MMVYRVVAYARNEQKIHTQALQRKLSADDAARLAGQDARPTPGDTLLIYCG